MCISLGKNWIEFVNDFENKSEFEKKIDFEKWFVVGRLLKFKDSVKKSEYEKPFVKYSEIENSKVLEKVAICKSKWWIVVKGIKPEEKLNVLVQFSSKQLPTLQPKAAILSSTSLPGQKLS